MHVKLFCKKVVTASLLLLLFEQCQNPTSTNNWQASTNEFPASAGNTWYILPSPDEVFNDIDLSELTINETLVNDIESYDKYSTNKALALNLGVYIADFAYLNIKQSQSIAPRYLKAIKDISQTLNIYGFMTDELTERVQRNISNNDSLIEISREAYFNITELLETSNRQEVLAMITAGTLIETLYLAAMSINDYNKYKKIVKNIFSQKQLINNVSEFIKNHGNNSDGKQVLTLIDSVNTYFGQNTTNQTITVSEYKNNHITVSGGNSVNYNEHLFIALKQQINNTRNKIVNLNN